MPIENGKGFMAWRNKLAHSPLSRWSGRGGSGPVEALAAVGGKLWLLRCAPGKWYWWEPLEVLSQWQRAVYRGPGPIARQVTAEAAWDEMRRWAASQGTLVCELDRKPGTGERAARPVRDALAMAPFIDHPAPGPWSGLLRKMRTQGYLRNGPWDEVRDGESRIIAKVYGHFFDSARTMALIVAAPILHRLLVHLIGHPDMPEHLKALCRETLKTNGLKSIPPHWR